MKPQFRNNLLLLAFGLLSSTKLFAQGSKLPSLITDRPSLNDASAVVHQGTFQIENGFLYQHEDFSEINRIEKEFRYPYTSIRIGVFKFAELRLKAALKHFEFIETDKPLNDPDRVFKSKTGIGNVSIGTKIQLLQNKGLQPEFAFQPEVQVPWGTRIYNPRHPELRLRFAFTNNLTKKLFLMYNLGMEWENAPLDPRRTFNRNYQYAVALGYKLTSNIQLYAEDFGQINEITPFEHGVDGGFVYFPGPHVQLDASASFGLNKATPDYLVEFGFVIRLAH